MSEKTVATASKETQSLESNDQMKTMSPPSFGLTAGGVDGGGGANKLQKHEQVGTPFDIIPIKFWPGEITFVHSPCFSQEIQAIGLQAQGNPGAYESAVSAIEEKVNYCLTNPFKNAEGKENNYALDRLQGSVPMNTCNLAATRIGSGWPKLVILTFWKDPSLRESGGCNYSYLFYLPFEALIPEEKDTHGGFSFIGDGPSGALDLSRHITGVAEMNEWLPAMQSMFNSLKPMLQDDPQTVTKFLKAFQRLFKEAKMRSEAVENTMNKGAETATSVKDEINRGGSENAGKQNPKWLEIDGIPFDTNKKYRFHFKDQNGQDGTVVAFPGYFKNLTMKQKGYTYTGQYEQM